MATSGSTNWQLTGYEIIQAALRKLGVLSGGSSPALYQTTDGLVALNAMLKTFEADGMPLWAMRSYTFNVVSGTAAYDIGEGQTFDTPAPLKVTQAWRQEGNNTANIPMNVYTDYNYNLLPLSVSSGTPVNLYYQPKNGTGTINLWPIPNDDTVTITIRYQRPFEDMDADYDDVDFPSYWQEAIIYGLASRLAPEYGIPLQDRQLLQKEAELYHTRALEFGTEEGGFFLQPDWSGRR